MHIDGLIVRLHGVRQTRADRWTAKCPAHDDRSPSLSIRDAGDRLLIKCHAGCEQIEVCRALEINFSDLFVDGMVRAPHTAKARRIPIGDLFKLAEHEITVAAILLAGVVEGRTISESEWDRLAEAAARIGRIRHA